MPDLIKCNKCLCLRKRTDFAIRKEKYLKTKILRRECKFCTNKRVREKWREIRKKVFDHYGWECVCCGETIKAFLSLDHIDNDGYLDKNPNGDKKSGKELYLLVIKQTFPKKYQTLCMNCNWGKKVTGVCPHQAIKAYD